MHRLAHLLLPVGAAATVVLLLAAILLLGGYDAVRALQALWAASFGSPWAPSRPSSPAVRRAWGQDSRLPE